VSTVVNEPSFERLVGILLDGTTFLWGVLVMLCLLIVIYRHFGTGVPLSISLALPRSLISISVIFISAIIAIAVYRRTPDLPITYLIFAPHIAASLIILPLLRLLSRPRFDNPWTGAVTCVPILLLALLHHRITGSFS
jgi:hypothetical protein